MSRTQTRGKPNQLLDEQEDRKNAKKARGFMKRSLTLPALLIYCFFHLVTWQL